MELHHIRKNFGIHRLSESDLPDNPMDLLKDWLKEISMKDLPDFNAMVLSTVGSNNKPSSRIVLLKDITDTDQLTFFTNYESKKGIEISLNNNVSINFFWSIMERQVRIEGTTSKISRKQSQDYFDSRPSASRISAILSPQSKEIKSLEELQKKATAMMENQVTLKIPENWGGYCVSPEYFEFWQGGANRLHDRIAYSLEDDKWYKVRLAP